MMKYILLIALFFAVTFSQTICPADVFNKCETDIQKAFQYCEQAAKEKGQDQTADLNCMKWSLTVKKDCWPCVCEVAKKEHYTIKGCDTIMEIIAVAKQLRDLTN